MNSRNLLVLGLLALLIVPAFSYEPEVFIAKETHLLGDDELAGDNISIAKGETDYFVVQITVSNKTIGYIALDKFEKKVIENEVLNKQLFQTAEFISEYQKFKLNVSENPALIWFVVNWGEVNTVSNKISNEELELQLIASELNSSEGLDIVGDMGELLSAIKTNLEVLKNKMSGADASEGSFLTTPVVSGDRDLKDSVVEAAGYLEQLHELNLQYETLQQQLAIAIAGDPDLSIETKQQLNKTANLPDEFQKIEKWWTSAQQMQLAKTMNSIYQNAAASSSTFASHIQNRLKRQETFIVLYEEDLDLKKKTNGDYVSLRQAFDSMNSEELKDYWLEQEGLGEFFQQWNIAESKFNKGDYDRSLEAANQAKKAAVAVHSAGLISIKPGPDYGTLITGIALIIILLVILYVVRNRGRLAGFVGGAEEEERVDFDKL